LPTDYDELVIGGVFVFLYSIRPHAYTVTRLYKYTTTTRFLANRLRHVCDKIYVNQKETMQDLRELFTTMSPNYSGEATIFANRIRPTYDNNTETDAQRDVATPPQTKKDINK